MKRVSVGLGLVFSLISCASESPTVNYYQFSELVEVINQSDVNQKKSTENIENQPLILIEPIALADFLRQPGLVIQKTNHQLQISSIHRWAEGLNRAATRFILLQLEKQLPNFRIEKQSSRWTTIPEFRISIEMDQFQVLNHKNQTLTSGQYWIFDKNKVLQAKHKFVIEQSLTDDGYDHAVSKLELSLVQLASRIANDITNLKD